MNDAPPRRSIAPLLLGFGLTSALLLVIGYAASQRRAATLEPPPITIATPSPGAVIGTPLIVRFETARPIALRSSGWGFQRFHLHAWINGIEYMPAAADIRPIDQHTYEWTFAGIQPGSAELQLAWSDQAHRKWPSGSSAVVSFRIR